MQPIAAPALALLGLVSGSACAEILLYEPTGPHHVSQTQHVFNHTTPDDFTAPNGAGVGTLMLVTIYAPTLSVPDRTIPYIDATNADLWGTALGLAPSSLSSLVTSLQHDAPHLSGPGLSATTCPHPTILFLPGAGMPCFAYTAYLSELASQGYAVVALDHPGEPPYLALPGGIGDGGARSTFPPLHNYTWPQYQQIYAHRLADAAALLSDAYLPALVRDRGWPFDVEAMGVFGHSIGGAAAAGVMAAAAAAAAAARRQRQQQDRQPQPFSAAPDATSSAATSTTALAGGANLDGWYFFDVGDLAGNGTGEPYPDLAPAGPFLELAKEEPRVPDATWANFGAAQSGWLRDVGVRRAKHFDFGDFPLLVDGLLGGERGGQGGAVGTLLGGVEGARMTAIVTGFLKAFFGAVMGRGHGGLEAVDAFQKSVGEETWVREALDCGVGQGE